MANPLDVTITLIFQIWHIFPKLSLSTSWRIDSNVAYIYLIFYCKICVVSIKYFHEDSTLSSILETVQSLWGDPKQVSLREPLPFTRWGGYSTENELFLRVPLSQQGSGDGCHPGDSHFFDKSGLWVRKDVALIPAQSTAWAIKVDSQVSIISFHRHTYILFKERKSIKKINNQVSFLGKDEALQRC